jgi:phosphate transport system permease protein
MSGGMESGGARRFRETPASARQRRIERGVRWMLLLVTMGMVLPLVGIVGHLVWEGAPALRWSLLVESPRNGMRDGGLWPALVGTVYLVLISLGVAAPVGVAAGIFLHEYARESAWNRWVQAAVINLAGVPSIVHALFGLGAFVYGARLGYSVLSASLTLAVMTLPVIITSTREALASVPQSFREACWNVGATRWQTLRAVVLPNAVPGILTGVILQVSRSAGETAPILFTGAVFFKAVRSGDLLPYRLDEQCMALAMHLYTLATQVPGVRPALPAATAVVLLGVVLTLNAGAILIRTRLRTRRRW